jgi:hypothetical protein
MRDRLREIIFSVTGLIVMSVLFWVAVILLIK